MSAAAEQQGLKIALKLSYFGVPAPTDFLTKLSF